MRTTWSDDCDRAVARAQCGRRGEPDCLQLGCRRCAQEQILKAQFEYGVIANAIGDKAALKAAVEELGKLRAHVGRTAESEKEISLWRRAIASGGAVSPADVDEMDAEAADEAARDADHASDWARDEAALAELEDRATQDALTQEAENANADGGQP